LHLACGRCSKSLHPAIDCRRPIEDIGLTHRIVAHWVGCGPHSFWQGNRFHPGTQPLVVGSLLHMCWNTVVNREKIWGLRRAWNKVDFDWRTISEEIWAYDMHIITLMTHGQGPVRHWWEWLWTTLLLVMVFGEDGEGRDWDGH
ncbi:hypothetical protein GOODEAATRI_018327, partial [Goodea atripinnis]